MSQTFANDNFFLKKSLITVFPVKRNIKLLDQENRNSLFSAFFYVVLSFFLNSDDFLNS